MDESPGARQLAVIGAAACGEELARLAEETGRQIALAGAVLLTGGRGGVMAAASCGARAAGGRTVGILPGDGPASSPPNEAVEVAVYTGIGQARNQVLVLSAAAVIAVGGAWGTLSEIACAVKYGRPVVLLASWELRRPDGRPEPLLLRADAPAEAVALALAAAGLPARP
jgi:uncharacterized protein (TIGR00725 family)